MKHKFDKYEDTDGARPQGKSRMALEAEIKKLQTTIAYMARDIRLLTQNVHILRMFALDQIFFDRDLVTSLGKPYLPKPPQLEKNPAFEQIED